MHDQQQSGTGVQKLLTSLALALLLFLPLIIGSCLPKASKKPRDERPLAPPVAIEHYRDLEIVFAISGGWKPNRQQEVGLKLVVRNTSNQTIELKWPSAKTHDFRVKNSKGKTVWQWSKKQSFAQAFKTKTLKSGSKMVIKSTWDQKTNSGKTAPRGKYRVLAEFEPMGYFKKLGPLGIQLVK